MEVGYHTNRIIRKKTKGKLKVFMYAEEWEVKRFCMMINEKIIIKNCWCFYRIFMAVKTIVQNAGQPKISIDKMMDQLMKLFCATFVPF